MKKEHKHNWVLTQANQQHYKVILARWIPIQFLEGLTGEWEEIWRCDKCLEEKRIRGSS